jgi:UDP-glucose 4-epimerase
MAKVAVTGGAGFIGSNLSQKLISEGHEVTIIDDLSTGLTSNIDKSRSIFHELSITNTKELKTVLRDCETIFHLAARGSVPRSIKNPSATHDVNATGTVNILEVARETGAHVIFSSSSSVYGRNMQLPKNESMWLGPMTPYAASKLASEGYVQAYATSFNVPITLLRFFNVFGPRQRPDHEYAAVLPKWIWLAMHERPISVYGDGTSSRDFTYVETIVDIAISAMKNRITTDGAVNLAYGNRIYLKDVIQHLRGHFPNLEVNYENIRLGDVKESQNDPELLNRFFPGITPKPFEEALAETVSWLKEFGESIANGPKTLD